MPWALVVHGHFIIDSEIKFIEESNFEGARLKKKYRGVTGPLKNGPGY